MPEAPVFNTETSMNNSSKFSVNGIQCIFRALLSSFLIIMLFKIRNGIEWIRLCEPNVINIDEYVTNTSKKFYL